MPAVRTDSLHENDSETSALVLDIFPSFSACVSICTSSLPFPTLCGTLPAHYVQVLCRAFFFLKNLKGRVSERTLRNTERYALSRYLPHSHFFPNPSDFRGKKFAAVVSDCFTHTDWHAEHDSNSQCGENDPVHQCAWERWMSRERFLTPMRWERFQKPMRWERFQNLMRWETWLLWERFLRPTILRQISKRATKAQPEEFPWPAKPKLQAMIG